MINIVKPEIPYVPQNGDIDIYGEHHEYMEEMNWSDIHKMNPMPIVGPYSFSVNPWLALINAGILEGDVLNLKRWSENYCPCSMMDYYAIVPIAILTSDATVYTQAGNLSEMAHGLHEDADWNRRDWLTNVYKDGDIISQEYKKDLDHHLGDVCRAMLGSGYTDMILPSDGGHSFKFFTIPLDNGDKIVTIGWEWYNK